MQQYQKDRLELIKEILPLLGDNYILKGGTALKLYYGLDRYSDDIDLDSVSGYMNIKNHLSKHKDFNKWEVQHKKSTDTVSRFMIDYKATNHNGAYPLKIEISSRNKNLLSNKLLEYQKINDVNVYSLKELINQKINAYSNRDKIRDFYDIAFLLENHKEDFTNEQIISFYQKTYYKGLDEISFLLDNEIKTQKLTKNINADDFVISTMIKCEDILKYRQSIKPNDELKKMRETVQESEEKEADTSTNNNKNLNRR